jgi:hypothetical protein
MRLLVETRAHIRGHLELLWEVAYECGDPVIGDSTDIELAADWQGEPGKFCEAILTCGGRGHAGFIEELPDEPGHYQIHDLYDHAPDYVRKRMDRELARKAKGITVSQLRAQAGRKGAAAKWGSADTAEKNSNRLTNGDVCHDDDGKRMANGRTPAPAPARAHKSARTFVKPSIEDVRAYCLERKNHVDPQSWLDYYTARGWKFKGGQPMKDWKAAVRTWERNGFSQGSGEAKKSEPIKYRA